MCEGDDGDDDDDGVDDDEVHEQVIHIIIIQCTDAYVEKQVQKLLEMKIMETYLIQVSSIDWFTVPRIWWLAKRKQWLKEKEKEEEKKRKIEK